MSKNIYAYTEFDYKQYPGYISLNKRDDRYYLTVRCTEGACGQEIEVPFMELLKMISSVHYALDAANKDTK